MKDENLQSNAIFEMAAAFVEQTGRHIFLTGKAGTGKTTFLHYIKARTKKKTMVIAPTGVAAINAGGVTIHSLFQMPPGAFIPVPFENFTDADLLINNPYTLVKKSRIVKNKLRLFRELELLIIDEVSMLRCDLLDAIDTLLRHFRRQPLLPFGGVQILYIGDLFQLPPVLKSEEEVLLKNYYASPFFFEARVIQQAPPIYLELQKIYRQSDPHFVEMLNRIRNNCIEKVDTEILYKQYQPKFQPQNEDGYITLTTHNKSANTINREELEKLPGELCRFKAEISGEFPVHACSADEELLLKKGAQIMFIKNDIGEERRFYNGKIGKVTNLDDNKIIITFPAGNELELEKETWRNLRYKYVKEKDEIEEEELGAFTQYPIRLAWAVTIHKSQGLTFEKAVIDAGRAFAAGQVYVALSRCTTLEGIILKSLIHPHNIKTAERVIEFSALAMAEEQLQQALDKEAFLYDINELAKAFDCKKLEEKLQVFADYLEKNQVASTEELNAVIAKGTATANHLQEVYPKFRLQLQHLAETAFEVKDNTALDKRLRAGVIYFTEVITTDLLQQLEKQEVAIEEISGSKRLSKEYNELMSLISAQLGQLQDLRQQTSSAKAE